MIKKPQRILIGSVATMVLAIVAVAISLLIQRQGVEPIAPSAPKSQPRATEVIPTPGANSQCRVQWLIAVPTAGPSATPTPTGQPAPTNTPTPTGQPLPTNTPPGQPPATNTPRPTTLPTVAQVELPEAGGIDETIGLVVGGIGMLLLGLLLLL